MAVHLFNQPLLDEYLDIFHTICWGCGPLALVQNVACMRERDNPSCILSSGLLVALGGEINRQLALALELM